MANNILVINVDLRETRVALIEDGIIAELHVERAATRGTLGNIVLGKVTRVLPGMQAAFIDIGLERAAFLHVEDLIRPDDFEAYLGGAKRDGEEPSEPDSGDAVVEAPTEPPSSPERQSPNHAAGGAPQGAPTGMGAEPASAEPGNRPSQSAEEGSRGNVVAQASAEVGAVAAKEPDAISEAPEEEYEAGEDVDSAEGDAQADDLDDTESSDGYAIADDEDPDPEVVAETAVEVESCAGDLQSTKVTDAAASEPACASPSDSQLPVEAARVEGPVPVDPKGGETMSPLASSGSLPEVVPAASVPSGGQTRTAAPSRGAGEGRGLGSGRRDDPRGKRDDRVVATVDARGFRNKASLRHGRDKSRGQAQKGREGRGGRPRNGHRDTSRISRSTPIREVIREGQEIVVQVSKEPIGTKGARVTSHISLPGRYVVYMPTIDQIGISKRIGSDKERARLREAIESIKPPTGGLIVRTVAEGLTKKQLKADVGYLVRLWAETAKKRDSGTRAPTLLYQELDLVLKTARDLFNDEIEQIVIDDREQYQRLTRFVEMFMPERVKDIVLYTGDEPIFDAYGIEDEIGRALSRKVPLTSGGYLIIDEAEALTAIDVNTGRYVGKGSKDLEDTLYKTNLEAVEEIAYQLRFRNLGGLIVLDLIDMERASNREKIRRRLEELLQKDKAKTTLNRISDLGLIEMTRKRTRESLGRSLHEPCFYCDGTGQLQSKQTIIYEILRQIRRDRAFLPGYSVVVNAHPAIIDLMKAEEREAVHEAERRFMRRIELVPRKEYHLEQFDLAGK